MQIIQSNFAVVIIPAIPERIYSSNSTVRAVLRDCTHAPRVVRVLSNGLSVFVHDSDYITLQVLEEVIRFAIILDTAYRIFIVIHRDNGVAAPRFFEDFGTVQNKGMLDSIYSLTRSDPVGIVGVLGIIKGLELSALLSG